MPYTVGSVYERSNPIPMVDTQDPDMANLQAIGNKIISDEVKSDWFFELEKLVSFRRNDPDPIRRDHCTDDYDMKDILFIMTEDGELIDAMAEFNQHYTTELENDDEAEEDDDFEIITKDDYEDEMLSLISNEPNKKEKIYKDKIIIIKQLLIKHCWI